MHELPTVILRHETRTGGHYDWLLATPAQPYGPLWTARMQVSPTHWRYAGTWIMTALPDHRRIYLNYQGPISDHRGVVKRVDEGVCLPLMWTDSRLTLNIRTQAFTGCIGARSVGLATWRAAVLR